MISLNGIKLEKKMGMASAILLQFFRFDLVELVDIVHMFFMILLGH